MKKILAMFLIFLVACVGVGFLYRNTEETVLIYTSTEDYNMELLQKRLDEKFPHYKIEIEYMSTSNVATKVLEEGEDCEADIVYALEYAYLEKLVANNKVADLKGEYDLSIFEDDLINDSIKDYILPNQRTGASVIINNNVLKKHNLNKPTSFTDLLNPEYANLISMPSPKASGTGYSVLLNLVNSWGENEAFNYFNSFANNVISFTSSGSGPVNALISEEAAIGIGMISQAVEKINNGLTQLEVLFFDDAGTACGLYGAAVVKGKEHKTAVMEVMDYIYHDFTNESCGLFYPEPIFKNVNYTLPNFPTNIRYGNMSGNTLERKEQLLKRWSF